ncbi:ribosomal RNA small subunit methyltransferase H [Nitrospira sp.]|nr:ribosomal RNA small subunit methyltransferase H [Nitrospira sp.]
MGEKGLATSVQGEPHVPVLSREIIDWMPGGQGAVYVDCTVGYGGLASRLLSERSLDARLIGIDRDPLALLAAAKRLEAFGARVTLIAGNFSRLGLHLEQACVGLVDGIILDLGVSSPQLDSAERGFSFTMRGPLDMRMTGAEGRTAGDLVNCLPEVELADVIFQYGEERYARRIARGIARAREQAPLLTTVDLAEVIRRAVPPGYRHGRLHCATRTFQALRIAVNRELDELAEVLPQALQALKPGGRLAAISFHSLEDRIVKHAYRNWSTGERPLARLLTKKPIQSSDQECAENPRARSAKLRIAERLS